MLGTLLAVTLLIRGDVRDAAGKPLVATVQSPFERTDSTADGHFVLSVRGEWPKEVRVAAPGYGTEVVDVPRARTDTNLDSITLHPAATLHLHIDDRPDARSLTVNLGMLRDDGAPPRWIATRRVAPPATNTTFQDLGPGAYVVLAKGSGPLECFAEKVILGAGSTQTVSLRIIRRRVHFQVEQGGQPAKSTRFKIRNRDYFWDAFLTTDERGAIDASSWAVGDFETFLTSTGTAQPVKRFFTLARQVTIDFPARTVRGTVVDHDGAPVPRAAIVFRTPSQSHQLSLHATTDSAGRFAFAGVESAESSVDVYADGFLIARGSKTAQDDVRIALDRGVPSEVTVVSHDGTPLSRAEVLCVSGPHVLSRAITGADGRALIATPAEASILYVVPEQGSFAVKRLDRTLPSSRRRPEFISVPEGTASVRINTLAATGKPIPGMFVMMRHNGETIPPEVTDEMDRRQGIQLRSSDTGQIRLAHVPVGSYEFWPYHSDDEVADIVDTAGAADAPIKVQVLDGENTVTVRFREDR